MNSNKNNNKHSALIIEEKPICRIALGQLLRDLFPIDLINHIDNLNKIFELLSSNSHKLILIDLFTINYDFAALKRLASRFGGAGMVVIDDRDNPLFSRAAEGIGLSGYVAKVFEPEMISEAITEVLAGGRWYSHRAGRNGDVGGGAKPGELTAGLTTRQSEVLAQLSLGTTNQEIAQVLNISPGTVKAHVHAILKLVGARNRTEAALLAGRLLRNEIADY